MWCVSMSVIVWARDGNPICTGAVGPFLVLCRVLSYDSCTHALWFLHGTDMPHFMWCKCFYCYIFVRKCIWSIGNWFCLLDIRFVDGWPIFRWNLYMLSFYKWYISFHCYLIFRFNLIWNMRCSVWWVQECGLKIKPGLDARHKSGPSPRVFEAIIILF